MADPIRLDDMLAPAASPVQPPQVAQARPLIAQAPPQAPINQAPMTRSFFDPPAVRKAIYDNVLQAASRMPPVQTTRHRLELTGLHYADKDEFTPEEEKHAILSGGSLMRRLRGTARLIDLATEQPISEKAITVAQVPHLTNYGTFIMNGSSWGMKHQMRLRSGVFTRTKDNGETESFVNVLKGGQSHRYWLDPESGMFRIQIGQSSVPLLPLLKAMGTSDKELKDAWGHDLLTANVDKNEVRTINNLYTRLMGRKAKPDASNEEKSKAIKESFEAMELDPEVTKRTLKNGGSRLNKETILDITHKLLAVNRGESDTDDRDHLAYQHFVGPEDVMAERFDRAGPILRQILWKAANKGHLDSVQPGFLTKHLHDAIMTSGLGSPGEEVNPLELLDQQTGVTRMGLGGIANVSSIPMDARAVHPSQLGYVDLLRTPESLRAGVDLRIAYGARKGPRGEILSPFVDVRTGKQDYYNPVQVADKVLTTPDEMQSDKPYARALVNSRIRNVPKDKVDLVMPHFEYGFSPLTNLVPLKSTMKGQRASMTSRFLTQALPIEKGEAPLVQNAVPGTNSQQSFDEMYGKNMGAIHAEQNGRVAAVDANKIVVKYEDGSSKTYPMYDNAPYNRKTSLTNTSMVQPGDPVKPGQILAKSNYTDDKGRMALGLNARVAYTTWRGKNYEDAITISRSFADRMKSQHHYQHVVEWDPTHIQGKRSFLGALPGEYDRKTMETLDDDGVVKPGTRVKTGDPLIVALRERDPNYKTVHGGKKGAFSNASTVWDHEGEGIVTDAVKTDKGVNVAVSSLHPMQEADKLSSRFANKGVVTILDDADMPHDKDGKPFEVALNPLGIQTRTNLGVAYETILGKIAKNRGEGYKIEDFGNIKDMAEFVGQELKKHGMEATETIVDPKTGRHIPNVLTGMQYMMKLHHEAEGKSQGRGLGAYSADDTPARGGYDGAKQQSLQETGALLSSGAVQVLRDSKLVRGQKNQEYWSTFMSGHKPATPKVPYVYEKFVNQLKASGINVVRNGSATQIMPMTQASMDKLVGDREIRNVETVDWKGGLKPVAGGLFDESLTGSHSGDRWSFIRTHEPLPNPIMEDGIRRLMGLTQSQFRETLAGTRPFNGKTGPTAIKSFLAGVNVDKAIEQAMSDVKGTRKTARDDAVKKLHFLVGSKKLGQTPADWMFDKVPVIPPKYRPVSIMQNTGGQLVADANLLYKEVWDANQALKELSGLSSDVSAERLNLYDAFKGVTGMGDPIQPKNVARGVKGFLDQVFSESPKYSTLQRKLLSTPVDAVGRGVVIPNPDLGLDEIGIPENQAWDVYKPFVVRRLVRGGMGRLVAAQAVQDKTEAAKRAILDEMGARPVLMSRAPVLHRYGIQAFWPKMVKGNAIQTTPAVTAGMGMDYDGDQSFTYVICKISNETVCLLGRLGYDTLEKFHYSKGSKMTARFNVDLPTSSAEGDVYVLHLKDFPRLGKIHTTKGQFGPIDWHPVPSGVKTLSIDARGDLVWADVSMWSIHYDCPVQIVNLQSGRQIFTDDDPRAVLGVSGNSLELKRTTPSKAVEERFIVPRFVKAPEVVDQAGMLTSIPTNGHTVEDGRSSKCLLLKERVPLTEDFGYLIGALIGDGWAGSMRGQVCLSSIVPAIGDRCDKAIQQLFISDFPKRGFIDQNSCATYGKDSYGKSAKYTWSSQELTTFVASLIGRGASNKSMPKWFLRAPREFQKGLFAGLMDTDGTICICKPKPTKPKPQMMANYSSNSLILCQELVLLTGVLGIRSRISVTKTPAGNPAWVVSISSLDLKQQGHGGMLHPDKIKAFDEGVVNEGSQSARNDIIPIPTGLAKQLRTIVGLPNENRKEGHSTAYAALSTAIKRGCLSRNAATISLRILEELGKTASIDHPAFDKWKFIVSDKTVTWDPVESFEDTGIVETGYDLTVPDVETFAAADGVILSNTSNFHVPVSDEAVEESINKLLPSRNLLSPADFKPAFAPRQEFHGGLYLATAFRNDKKKVTKFRNKVDLIAAIKRGEIELDDPVEILEHR